jgi:hypothetical protein
MQKGPNTEKEFETHRHHHDRITYKIHLQSKNKEA